MARPKVSVQMKGGRLAQVDERVATALVKRGMASRVATPHPVRAVTTPTPDPVIALPVAVEPDTAPDEVPEVVPEPLPVEEESPETPEVPESEPLKPKRTYKRRDLRAES